jgi:cytochrome P450
MNTSPGPFRHPFYQDGDGVNRPTGPDRHPLYRRFAREGAALVPVLRDVGGRDVPASLVCRYEDVREVLRDQRTFSRSAAGDVDDVDVSGTMLGMDGPEHDAVRGIVKKAFLPAATAALAGMVETRAAALLAIMTGGGRNADLVTDFALPFALHTIADMLGLPDDEKERLQFRQWGDAFLGTADAGQAAESAMQMAGYLGHQLHRRRSDPADDLLTRIAGDGAGQPPEIQVRLAISLIVGGWETTASSIARYVYVLRTKRYGDHPTGWDYTPRPSGSRRHRGDRGRTSVLHVRR